MSESVLPMFSSRSFIVSGLTFRRMGFIYCQTVYTAASKYVDPKKNSLKRVHIHSRKRGPFTIHDPHKDINILTFDRY